jgi:hypothetical protein
LVDIKNRSIGILKFAVFCLHGSGHKKYCGGNPLQGGSIMDLKKLGKRVLSVFWAPVMAVPVVAFTPPVEVAGENT